MIFRSFVTFIPRDFAVDFSTKDIFCSLKWDLPRWDQNYPAKSLQFCPTLCDPMTVARKAPLSMGFCRQEYQSGLPFPSPGDLADPQIKPMSLISPALASGFFTTSATWEAHKMGLRGIHLPNSALIHVVQFSSVTQLCPTLCNPMDCSIPGFPVHHQPLELAQTHVYWVSDAIQPSHPLSSLSPPAFNLSQHQGLFQGVSSSHQVAKVLEFSFNISPSNKHSGLNLFRIDWFDLLAVQGILEFSPTPQFKSINSSALSFLYSPTLTSIDDYWKKRSFD